MTDESLGDPVDRLAAVNEIMLEMGGEECVDHTYDAFLQMLHSCSALYRGKKLKPQNPISEIRETLE